MKQDVTEDMFRRQMMARRPDNFSWGNLSHLYHYLVDSEGGGDYEIEFDPISICNDFDEYKNFKEFQDAYGKDYQTFEDIEDATIVIYGDYDSFIIQAF